MSKRKVILVALAVGCVAGLAAAQHSLEGHGGNMEPLKRNPEATEQLFRGDLTPELGLGCSNSAGTSGGPNDVAVQVTAALAPPFHVISTTYNVFTNLGAVTTHSFVAWAGGGAPGAELGRQPVNPAQGNHTSAIAPAIPVASAAFNFGFNQPQPAAGMRWGMDSSAGTAHSRIRAPTCGAAAFTLVTALGFPGNWVMAAVIDDMIPVELMSYDVE